MNFLSRFLHGLSANARTQLYEALAGHIENGLTELEALRLLYARTKAEDKAQKAILLAAINRMESGATLAQSLQGHVPDMEYMLLSASDMDAQPKDTLLRVVDLVQTRTKILAAVRNALAYPIFLFVLFIALLLTVSLFVVPSFATLIPYERWYGFAELLRQVADFTASWKAIFLLFCLLFMIWLILFSLPRWTGRIRTIADHLPPWSLYRLLTSAAWLYTFGILLQGGIRSDDALRLTLEGSPSPWLTNHLESLYDNFSTGKELGESLAETSGRFLEEDMAQDLAFYASLPHFSKRLPLLAAQWLGKRISQIERACRQLNGFGIICIFFLLCFVGLAIKDLVGLASQGTSFF